MMQKLERLWSCFVITKKSPSNEGLHKRPVQNWPILARENLHHEASVGLAEASPYALFLLFHFYFERIQLHSKFTSKHQSPQSQTQYCDKN